MQNNREALMRLSHRMRWLCIVAVLALGVFAAWMSASWLADPASLKAIAGDAAFHPERITMAARVGIVVVNGVGMAFLCIAFWNLSATFDDMADGNVFTNETARDLRVAGGWFLANAVWALIVPTLNVLLITMNNPVGERSLSVAASSNQLYPMVLAGVLFAVSHMLVMATEMDEENKGFV